MANTKLNYYEVTTTTWVKAPNRAEAEATASKQRGATGVQIGQRTNVARINGTLARERVLA